MIPSNVRFEISSFLKELSLRREFISVYGVERGLIEWGWLYSKTYEKARAVLAERISTVAPENRVKMTTVLRESIGSLS